jgi:hypothetical protein
MGPGQGGLIGHMRRIAFGKAHGVHVKGVTLENSPGPLVTLHVTLVRRGEEYTYSRIVGRRKARTVMSHFERR